MRYKNSKKAYDLIKNAENILINCHRGPDPDSIGSALAMKSCLETLRKTVKVVCVSKDLYPQVDYLYGYDDIENAVDYSKFNFSEHDLMICLDSSSLDMVFGKDSGIQKIPIKSIVIDHHTTNKGYGDCNIIDKTMSSTGELIYNIFEDWGVAVDKNIADCLMAAIVGDTGAFRFPSTTNKTLEIVVKLIEKGADKNKAIYRIYGSESINLLKFWGEVLVRMQYDEKGKYVWSAIPNEVYKKYASPSNGKETAASQFAQIVEGTNFGIVMVEQDECELNVSFRSRSGFDTSKIAEKLGGGGHIYASGARVKGSNYDDLVKMVLETTNKFLN